MNGVFFVNSRRGLQKALKKISDHPFSYLVLKEYLSGEVTKALSLTRGEPIHARDVFQKVNRDFGEDIVAWMGDLNNSRESIFWNRLNLAGKRVHSTGFCEHVFYSTCLNRVLEAASRAIVVVAEDPVVIRQTKDNWNIRPIHDFTEKGSHISRFLTEVLPGRMIRQFFLAVWRKCISGRARLSQNLQRLVVIKTVISAGSFGNQGDFRDLYFGDLLSYLKENGRNVLVVGNVLDSYRSFLKASQRSAQGSLSSIEQWLTLPEIVACFIQALWALARAVFSAGGTLPFRGNSIRLIVRDSVMKEVQSDQYLVSVMNEKSTRKIVEGADVDRFFLPFENRGFERADIRVIRERSRGTRIIGYQHATITKKHTEYFRSRNDRMPLPDVVIASGEMTSRILVDLGLFPREIVKTGCALRQRGNTVLDARRTPAHLRFLVVLSASRDYYHRMIVAINSVYQEGMDCSFRLCPHPMIPLTKELRSKIRFPLAEDILPDRERMIDSADVAIYSSSTLAINCLQRGKPLFYMPVDDFLDADPLFELSEAKWTILTKEDFIRAMAEVRSRGKDQWEDQLSRAQAFVSSYFGPVTNNAMHLFLE